MDEYARVQGRWARTWVAWLQEYHPREYQRLLGKGKITREADRFDRRCQETINALMSDLRRADPGPRSYLERVQHLNVLESMAAEQVLHDLLPVPETPSE